jgi:hypothetical protein
MPNNAFHSERRRNISGTALVMTRTFAALILLLSASVAVAGDVSLQCDMAGGGVTNLQLSSASSVARLVINDAVVDGTVQITEHHYRFVFPKSLQRYETRIAINRLTGELFWEHGVPPFGEANLENMTRSGTCKNRKAPGL